MQETKRSLIDERFDSLEAAIKKAEKHVGENAGTYVLLAFPGIYRLLEECRSIAVEGVEIDSPRGE